MNIEEPNQLVSYLRGAGHLEAGESPVIRGLPGGVSNRTVLVQRANGASFVIKQALAKLRVEADWRSDPSRSHREALGLQWLARLAPAGTITPFLFEDPEHHVVAMAAVPQPHENWKTRLLAGHVEMDCLKRFGALLGTIHRRAAPFREELRAVFDDRTFFETLRLEPYYLFAASRNPGARRFLEQLIAETLATRETLTHGDYSPKNVLIHENEMVLLDHEVVHWGDPAFDLGFSLTHVLSKALHVDSCRAAFLTAAGLYWESYCEHVGEWAKRNGFEARVARHTLGCLLARVDGRSPLEYLSGPERDQQRAAVLAMMDDPPATVLALVQNFGQSLES
ncbi:MAG: aminoglycoside phosphotransferase family protein [Verrucomicrobia bacterium]|nr:aminoglycoside phosphotransferase family protein [Verrucomicrobiota bacterium]